MLHKLQSLSQRSKTIDEYYHEMDQALMRLNSVEDEKTTMVRFMNGLNKNIAKLVELHQYTNLDDLYQMAVKIEWQLKKMPQTVKSTQPLLRGKEVLAEALVVPSSKILVVSKEKTMLNNRVEM